MKIKIIHTTREVLFEKYNISEEMKYNLFYRIENSINKTTDKDCGIYFIHNREYILSLRDYEKSNQIRINTRCLCDYDLLSDKMKNKILFIMSNFCHIDNKKVLTNFVVFVEFFSYP